MPAANPRLTITLQPQVHAVMRELASLTGNSQSALVGELLEQSLPVFERMVQVLDAARRMKEQGDRITDEAKNEIARSMERAQGRIEQQVGLALEDMEEGFRPVLVEAEKIERRGGRARDARSAPRPGRHGAARSTPLSNRGVRLTQQAKKAKK